MCVRTAIIIDDISILNVHPTVFFTIRDVSQGLNQVGIQGILSINLNLNTTLSRNFDDLDVSGTAYVNNFLNLSYFSFFVIVSVLKIKVKVR